MNTLYYMLRQYESLTYYQEYQANHYTTMEITNTFTKIEIDRFDNIVLTSNDGGCSCILNPTLSYNIKELPFNRDLIILTDYKNHNYIFNAKKI